MPTFREKVIDIVRRIPSGHTLTYAEVAKRARSPRACRAVGNIMNANHDPEVPCHRVIRADGAPGGYNRGEFLKISKLAAESSVAKMTQVRHFSDKALGRKFFDRRAHAVARELLGKYLVRRLPEDGQEAGRAAAAMITDTEAYDGFEDKASHASRGLTARNAPMFGEAGHWYVYFTYGMHWMLNAVTGREGYPAAVLIRGVGPWNGPARLTKALGIAGNENEAPISPRTGLWIEDRGVRIPSSMIRRSPRIGVDYAGAWAKKPLRFHIEHR